MITTAPSNDKTLAVFAHELREPLAAIRFAADAMNSSSEDQCVQREMCEIIERQSRYLALMIDDVLDACSSISGKTYLRRDWFDLNLVIAQAVETTSPLLQRRRHHLAMSVPTEGAYVLVDALRLQQVVVNLLSNAAKYTNPGGCIRLTIEVTDDQIAIEVRDNGVGIPACLLPRIFDLFVQGEETPSPVFSGLGVGLALVKAMVELHGGNVTAHSDGPGTGSAFVVRLPGTNLTDHRKYTHRAAAPGSLRPNPPSNSYPMTDA